MKEVCEENKQFHFSDMLSQTATTTYKRKAKQTKNDQSLDKTGSRTKMSRLKSRE